MSRGDPSKYRAKCRTSGRSAAGRSCDGIAPWPRTQRPACPKLSNWPGRHQPGTARPRAPATAPRR
eukprot:8821435-Alexandrium_andersonii.AAC.1